MRRLAFTIAILGTMATAGAAQSSTTETLAGYISDSKCGAKQMDNGVGCVRKCIENGNLPVLVDAHKNVWAIENPLAVKDFYGDNVKVVARVNASGKTVYIDSISKTGGVMGGMKDGAPL